MFLAVGYIVVLEFQIYTTNRKCQALPTSLQWFVSSVVPSHRAEHLPGMTSLMMQQREWKKKRAATGKFIHARFFYASVTCLCGFSFVFMSVLFVFMCHWDPCETRVLIVWYNATVFPCTGSLTQVITGSIGGFRAWQIDIDWCVVSLCFILNALKFDYLTSGSDFSMYINAELRQCSVNFIWQFYNAQAKSNSRDADIWFHFMQYSMAQIQFQRRIL